jgi:hypothetical protein
MFVHLFEEGTCSMLIISVQLMIAGTFRSGIRRFGSKNYIDNSISIRVLLSFISLKFIILKQFSTVTTAF